jgi:OOP family OmpA-OmpF porin
MTKTKTKTTQRQGARLPLLALTTLGALIATPAFAQDASYTYGGIAVGQSRGKIDGTGLALHEIGNSATLSTLSQDDKDNAYRLFLGYQFNRSVGLEASFFNLGKFNSHATTTAPTGTLDGQLKIQGGGVDVVGALPLSENWSLLGRVGGQFAKTRDTFTGNPAFLASDPSPSARQFNYKVGAGLQYRFSPNFLMRAEADQYRSRDAIGGNLRVQVFSLSVVVPFGAGATRMAAAPAYKPVAYTPPAPTVAAAEPMVMTPAPMVAVAPPAPPATAAKPRSVSFSAESLFGFDKSTIRPEGKAALDTFAREMVGTEFSVIVVNGYADRIGSAAYNQTLSLQRADAVKAYLVAGGLDASKITTTGLGETSPVTQTGDCKASLPTAELRTCLQPDRRVDVDVNGTR